MLVRDVRPSDAKAIVSLFNPIIEAGCYTTFVSPFTVASERKFIEDLPTSGIFLGAFDAQSGQLRGFQVVTPLASYTSALDHVAEIGTHVGLSHHRQGIAGNFTDRRLNVQRLRVIKNLWLGYVQTMRPGFAATLGTDLNGLVPLSGMLKSENAI